MTLTRVILFLACGMGFLVGAEKQRPNVLFIAIDDLRNDLGCLGASFARTPHLDEFATTARPFSHHYVQVPTCGASRLALLRGQRPTQPAHLSNGGIISTGQSWAQESLPGTFKKAGYQTLALGKIGHHPGGLTGKNWNSPPEELPGVWDRHWIPEGPWAHPVAIMHGYANGVARIPGKSPTIESFDGPDEAYPDGIVARDAVATLAELARSSDPWFFAVGFFKPHLPFAAPKKYFDLHPEGIPALPSEVTTKPAWPSSYHRSSEFRGNYGHSPGRRDPDTDPTYAHELRRAYTATVSYADAQVGKVLAALKAENLDQNTIVVVWGDHGFLLGEHAIWGKHCLYEHALRAPLLIRSPALAKPGKTSEAIVETVDLFPTLTDLCGIDAPGNLHGKSLVPQLKDPESPTAKPALGFWTQGQRTVRTDRWRLITDGTGERLELFDYQNDPFESKNHASAHPETVAELRKLLPEVFTKKSER